MSVKGYIKEKWYMFIFFFVSAVFSFLIYWADGSRADSSMIYTLEGIILFFIAYIIADYVVLRSRAKKIKHFVRSGATDDVDSTYPLDKLYMKEVSRLARDYNNYRARNEAQYSEELDFITKWVHDIKVPISALYLLIDNMDTDDADQLEMQTSYIEQHTQKVLYHIKSKSFHDDYQITEASTHTIVSTALKQYATFFAYKKISLNMKFDDYKVLTDEKWSGYIVSQLLSNAVKHTPEYGEISIKTSLKHNKIVISVKNTGEGIKAINLNQIFKKGYTSTVQRGGSPSTGYGLYLAKKLADRMGHNLYAVSKEGDYAEFCLAFSRTQQDINITKS